MTKLVNLVSIFCKAKLIDLLVREPVYYRAL